MRLKLILAVVILALSSGQSRLERGQAKFTEKQAMATKYFTGAAQDENWATAGNWNPSGAPAASGDSVIILAGAASGLSLNLDRSGDGGGDGLHLDGFTVEAGFRYSLGSTASPMKFSTTKFVDRGDGNTYFQTKTGAAGQDTSELVIDKGNGAFELTDHATSALLEIELVACRRMSVSCPNFGLGRTLVVPSSGDPFAVTLTITGGTAMPLQLFQTGGTVIIDNPAATIAESHLIGGTQQFLRGTVSKVYQSGGVFLHDSTTAMGGTLSAFYGLIGTLDSTDTGGAKSIAVLYRERNFNLVYNPNLTVVLDQIIGE